MIGEKNEIKNKKKIMKKRRKKRGIEKVETEQAVVRQRKNKRESKSYIGRLWGLRDGSK